MAVAGRLRSRANRVRARGWRYQYLVAFVPILVMYIVSRHPGEMPRTTTAIVALAVAYLISKYPVQAITALVSFVPVAVFIYSWAFKFGAPQGLLHQAQSWKELVIGALLIAAWRSHRQRPRKFDRLDWAAFAYVACILSYYAFPHLFTYGRQVLPHAARYAAMRDDVEYVIAFLAARHAGVDRSALRIIGRGVLISGAVVAFGGVYAHLRPSSWGHFVTSTVQVQRYRDLVQHLPLKATEILDYDAGRLRVGSTLLSPIVLGPFLLVPFALAIESIARRAASVFAFVTAGLCGGAILFTGTRSSTLGMLLIVIFALRPSPGRNVLTRVRLSFLLVVLIIIGAPVAVHSGIITRTTAAVTGTDASANGHIARFHAGVHEIAIHPLGGGLGTAAGLGQSVDPFGGITAEDYYLQVGDEVGIHTMIAFILLTIFLLMALYRSVSGLSGTDASGGAWLAAIALMFGAFLLHVWAGLTVSLVFWTLAGAVIGAADRDRNERLVADKVTAPRPRHSPRERPALV